jgi:hypothetical protein
MRLFQKALMQIEILAVDHEKASKEVEFGW